jgi:predicted ArsR family transcriptional regulator
MMEMQAELERAVTALQDPTRRAILLGFFDDPRPRTVDEVAAAADIHRTVAFTHLERLRALGYLAADSRRGMRGKPARLYRLASGPLELSHPPRRFQALAAMLVEALAGLGKRGRAAARLAGRGFQDGARAPVDGAAGVEQALEPLRGLGAEYQVCGERILSRNCVFVEACTEGIACEVQAGILEGALARAGIEARVMPEGREGPGCAYHVVLNERESD